MELLKNRKTNKQSRNKITYMINLYEKYVDEQIYNIRIISKTRYLVNDKWEVDISNNVGAVGDVPLQRTKIIHVLSCGILPTACYRIVLFFVRWLKEI